MSISPNSSLPDRFGARSHLTTKDAQTVAFYRIAALEERGLGSIDTLPFTVRVLLENVLRNAGSEFVDDTVVERLAAWSPQSAGQEFELPFMPGRAAKRGRLGDGPGSIGLLQRKYSCHSAAMAGATSSSPR